MATASELDAPALVHVNEPAGHGCPGKAPMEIRRTGSPVRRSGGQGRYWRTSPAGIPSSRLTGKEMSESLASVRFDTAAMRCLYRPEALKAQRDSRGPGTSSGATTPPWVPPFPRGICSRGGGGGLGF
ncbi:MAG: hypothetical protein LBT40_05130 [Deltaproteobacteria bacterium]|nr:hypothetical protein [Deltaproteobacteria bacterium]